MCLAFAVGCQGPGCIRCRAPGTPLHPFPSLAAPYLLARYPHLVMDPSCRATSPITKLLAGMATRLHLLGNSSWLPFVKKQTFGSDHSGYFIFSIIGEQASICHVGTKKDVGTLYNEQGDLYSNATKLHVGKQVNRVQDKRRWCSVKEVVDFRKFSQRVLFGCKMFLWVQKEGGKVLGGETLWLPKDEVHQAQEAPELNVSRGWENIREQKDHIRLHCSCPPLAGYRMMGQRDPWLKCTWPPCHLTGGFQEQDIASGWWFTGWSYPLLKSCLCRGQVIAFPCLMI